MKFTGKIRRVDVQVSILISITTVFCTFCVAAICYGMAYNDMIGSLKERVAAIYGYLESSMDKSTFYDINVKEDMNKESYCTMQEMLNNVKNASNVRYLYTAKKNELGEFIYIIDGLDYSAGDFRFPGDAIEKEIYGEMEKALKGATVLPDSIKKTDWGKIFITYLPIHDGQKVVGVSGIEFEADHQYQTYSTMLVLLPVIAVFIIFAATVSALLVFKRISNPTYKDMANTDQLTQLKNRNAYETDIRNMNELEKKNGFGIISIDLNNLKKVNDIWGHGKGDLYIQAAADAMQEAVQKKGMLYRTGGDEYAILINSTNELAIQELIRTIELKFAERSRRITSSIPLSLSMGYALYDSNIDQILSDVAERADAAMYRKKREFHGNS